MRKSMREKLIEAKKQRFKTTELNGLVDLVKLLVDGDRPVAERMVNPTQLKFIMSTDRYKAYKGPAGCAKTSTGVADILIHALLEPGSKYLIARADYNDLEDTTMLRFKEMLARLPTGTELDRNQKPPAKYWIRPAAIKQPDGTYDDTPSQITFMGLKDVMGSYEFNGAFIDEAAEVEQARVEEVKVRLRHMKGHRFLGMAFNPPDVTHWLYTECTGFDDKGDKVKTPTLTLFEPDPKENVKNLPPNFYEDLTGNLPEDMRQRLVDGVWGSTFPGDPMIRQFSRAMHVKKVEYKGGTLFCLWDFGYNRPAILFAQLHSDGHLEILREHLGHHIEGTKFIEQVKAKIAEWFPTANRFMHYGDPAVAQKKDTGQMAALLLKAGIEIRYQHTPFDVSMALTRKKFESLIEGNPAIVIDPRCPILIGGLSGGYHFKKDGITPHKDGYYDHLIDGLRYGLYNLFGLSGNTSTTIPDTIVAYVQ